MAPVVIGPYGLPGREEAVDVDNELGRSRIEEQTLPSVPTLTITALARRAGLEVEFEANGVATPHGYTVTYPAPVGSVTVTLSTTFPPRRARRHGW
jgi:hypothetical protein